MANEGAADIIYSAKDAGTEKFKAKKINEASQKFGEAIKAYKEDSATLIKDKNLKTVITQCYTNRSLCYHQLDRQIEALADADYVIKYLDEKNVKALYRRGFANKFLENWEDALKDFSLFSTL